MSARARVARAGAVAARGARGRGAVKETDMLPKLSESQVQRAILDYLAARHVLAYRMQSGLTVAEYKGKRRAFRSGVVGMADILAFRSRWRGVDDKGNWCEFQEIKPLWIECKAADGKQSDLQKSFQAQVEAEGHMYIIARSVDDVERALQ